MGGSGDGRFLYRLGASWLAVGVTTLSPLIALIVGFEGVRQASRAAIELPTAKSATTLLRLLSSGDATRLPSTQYSPDACEEFAQTERLGHIATVGDCWVRGGNAG